jgi:nitrate reductase alpha subunit
MLSLDFRMTSTTLFSDVVLPAATWYEKHDLNTTDMHPFIHAFTPAINPPWQTRTDFDTFHRIAQRFSELAGPRLGVRQDLVAAPLLHDTPDAMATPGGVVRDWQTGEVPAIPGRTMPKFVVVERDYGAISAKMGALGPLLDRLGTTTKAVTVDVGPRSPSSAGSTARSAAGLPTAGPGWTPTSVPARRSCRCPAPRTAGSRPRGFRFLERRTGQRLAIWRPSTRASRSGSPTARPGRYR